MFMEMGQEILAYLGKKVRKLRKAKGFTTEKLAELSDISYVYLSMIEHNKAPGLSLEIIIRLARVLGVSIAELTGEEEILNRALKRITPMLEKALQEEEQEKKRRTS